jgi:hypothetical protein
MLFSLAVMWTAAVPANAQTTRTTAKPVSLAEFVIQQFGSTCTPLPATRVQTGDLDGDGIEDAVIAARCLNPLPDQADHNFTVIDPYNEFYGYGNVKVTSGFVTDTREQRGLCVLIIHGAEAGAWRAVAPRAKFIVINLPFETVAVKRLALKKKTVSAVFAEDPGEGTGIISAVFWDGKKYRYMPMGSSLE